MRDIDCKSLLRLQENFARRSKLPWQPLVIIITLILIAELRNMHNVFEALYMDQRYLLWISTHKIIITTKNMVANKFYECYVSVLKKIHISY